MKKTFVIILILYLSITLFFQGRFFYYGGKLIYFWASVFLEIISVLSLLGIRSGLSHFLSVRKICKNGISANAVIKDFYVVYYRTKTYYPIIQFKDSEKISHKYQSTVGMSIIPRRYRKGCKIKIAYPEGRPNEFVIIPAYYYQAFMEIFLFAFLGIPSVIGSLILMIK